jgi:hypothetical protein
MGSHFLSGILLLSNTKPDFDAQTADLNSSYKSMLFRWFRYLDPYCIFKNSMANFKEVTLGSVSQVRIFNAISLDSIYKVSQFSINA